MTTVRKSAVSEGGVTLGGCALLAACLLVSRPGWAEPLERKALSRLGRSVLRIEASNANGSVAIGSGVLVAGEHVMTNCHVTRNATRVMVTLGSASAEADAQSAEMARDVCLLRVPGLQGAAVPPLASAGSLRQGEELVALGFTGGGGLRISSGRVVALHRFDGSQVIQCSNAFTSGASGGGLFDKNGALVGILTFRLPGTKAHFYAAPVDWLPEPANGGPSFAPVQPLQGRAFWEEAPDAQPLFLQAAALEESRRWDALAQLAERWAGEAADDPEPYYLQAVAREGLGELEPAMQAWLRSLDIDPAYSMSWARLARLYHRTGRTADAQRAIASLMARDPGLALEVSAELKTDRPKPDVERLR
jgi:serine protease Do